MSKMVVIYRKPVDPKAFEDHYFNIHIPLAKQLPGLLKYDVSRGPIAGRFVGDAPYMIGILSFGTMQDLQAAFASEAGKACAADVRLFAPNEGDMSMFLFEDEAV